MSKRSFERSLRAVGLALGIAALMLSTGTSTAGAVSYEQYVKNSGNQLCASTVRSASPPWVYLGECDLGAGPRNGWRIRPIPGTVGLLTFSLSDSLGISLGCLTSRFVGTSGGLTAIEPCDSNDQHQRWWTEGSPRVYIRSMGTGGYLASSAVDGAVRVYSTPGQARGGTVGAKWCTPDWNWPPVPAC
ncbi:hypothetical protein ACFVWG_19840 [Kribbella sp. NPDC058245]|uniref:hypothetical protein n=1 Tax=Kribbella sp. NPDC058245 TaxID=3346399 RepID=UPI0036E4C89D